MKKKIISSYQTLGLIKKLSIPPAIALLLGFLFTISIVKQVRIIKLNTSLLREVLIPSIEKTTHNILLLHNISENFTFAILSSDVDMANETHAYDTIVSNLEYITDNKKIIPSGYTNDLQLFNDYFTRAREQSLTIIETDSLDSSGDDELNGLLNLYNNIENRFTLLNSDIKKQISEKTQLIKHISSQLIFFSAIYALIFSLVLLFVSFLIYHDFNTRFSALKSRLSKLDTKRTTEGKLGQKVDELGILSESINTAMTKYDCLTREKNEIERKAERDQLTQLFNRNYLSQFFRKLDNNVLSYGITILDIDHFKEVNDTYGHQTGDAVLVKFAKILQRETRENDIVARWGGEEFLIIILDATESTLISVAQKIRKSLESTPFDQVGKITASFGTAIHKKGITVQQVIKFADIALYRAKEGGRNKVELYQQGTKKEKPGI